MRGLSFYAHAVGTAAFPGPRAGRRPRLLRAARRVCRGARLRVRRGAPRAPPARGLRQPHGARARRGARRRRRAGERRVPLGRQRRLAALRQPAADGHARPRARRPASAAAVAATLVLGPRWLARGFDPGAARALGLRSRLPDALLLVLVAFAVVASLTAIGALLATALFVVPAATVRLWTQRLRVWQLGVGRARGRAGHRRPLALGRAERAARTDRSPCSAARCSPLSLVWRAIAPVWRGARGAGRRGRAARPRPGRLRRRLGPHGHTGPDVVATTTQIGDWTRAVAGDAATRPPDPAAQHRPARVRAAAARRRGGRGAKIVFLNGDGLDAWMGSVISNAGGSPKVVDLGAMVPVRLPGESEGRRGLALRPALVARPAQRRGGRARDPRRARCSQSRRARAAIARTPPRTCAACARSTPASARASQRVPAARAEARLRSRRVRLLRAALRHHRRRRRDPVADHAGAALGRRHRRPRPRDPPRARARGLPGELAEPEARAADRARDRCARRLHALRRHARPQRLERRDLPRRWSGQRRRHDARLHGRRAPLPHRRASDDARRGRTTSRSATAAGPCSTA